MNGNGNSTVPQGRLDAPLNQARGCEILNYFLDPKFETQFGKVSLTHDYDSFWASATPQWLNRMLLVP